MVLPRVLRADFEDATGAEWFTWMFPGAPICIRIHFGLISRLQAEIAASSAAEIGGVLIGSGRPQGGAVEIRDYLRIPCAPLLDGRYRLNVQELDSLRQANPVVGFFRTHSKGVLRLRADDMDLVRGHFRDPANVVLLINSSNAQSKGGFFFWGRNGFLEISLKDFPFDAALLRRWEARPSVDPPVAEFEPALARQAGREGFRPKLTRMAELIRAKLRAALIAFAAFLSRTRRLWAIVAVASAFAVLLYLALSPILTWRQPKGLAEPVRSPIRLDVAPQRNNGLEIHWNPQSAPVADAKEGFLVVSEKEQKPKVEKLDHQRLASGRAYYRSASDRLEFSLAVEDTAGGVASDSLLVVSPKEAETLSKGSQRTIAIPSLAELIAPPVAFSRSAHERGRVEQPLSPPMLAQLLALPVPTADPVRVNTDRREIVETLGDPTLSTVTLDQGHEMETFVYGRNHGRVLTIIHFRDGKVSTSYAR